MPLIEGVLYCDGCGAEILGAPHVVGELNYCCMDCFHGISCDCGVYRDEEPGFILVPQVRERAMMHVGANRGK